MKQNTTLLLTALLCMFGTSVWAQDTPVADLLDVQFNDDGTSSMVRRFWSSSQHRNSTIAYPLPVPLA